MNYCAGILSEELFSYEHSKEEGLYKALPEDIIRRRIQGKYRFMLQYHPSWDSTVCLQAVTSMGSIL